MWAMQNDFFDSIPVNQIVTEALFGAKIRGQQRQVTDNQSRRLYPGGLLVLSGDASVADVRVGQGHDLSAVGGIRQDFLISGHRSIEDHLTHCRAGSTDRAAVENRAIFQCEDSGLRQTVLPVVIATRA